MPTPGSPLRSLGFLSIGLFDPDDPRPGHESTLRLVELGEQLGYDGVWLRNRHLQHGISSPLTVLAAASQRTSRVQLGTAVIPLGWENPLRLAEDLGTLDVLSGGRLNPGMSVGEPMHFADVRDSLYPDTADAEDFSYRRVERLLRLLGGEVASGFSGVQGIETFSPRVEPHSPGLLERCWYGAGSDRSAAWAGDQGLNLLTSSVVKVGEADPADFAALQRRQIDTYLAQHPDPARARVSQGLVVIPTDSATDEQAERYRSYAEARLPRTTQPQGPARLLFAPDLVGPAERIAEQLYAHAGFQAATEAVFALPFTFGDADYRQILTDIAERLGPLLGWRPGPG